MKGQNTSSNKGTQLGCGVILLILSVFILSIALGDGSIGTGTVVFVVFLGVIGILLIVTRRRQKKLQKDPDNNDETRENDIENLLNEIKSGNVEKIRIYGAKTNLILRESENILFMMPHMDYSTFVSTNEIKGGSGIGIMGYSISGGIESKHSEERRILDNGALIITNDRLVFDGEKRSSETMLSDVLIITPYTDGVGIKSRGREEVQFFSITDPEECTLSFEIEERSYQELINGKWIAAMVEGAIKYNNKPEKRDAK